MEKIKVYRGKRLSDHAIEVMVNENPLLLSSSLKVRNHSPTGFEWGYLGSGPSQLALAILLDFFEGDKEMALRYYMRFKTAFVSGWEAEWEISSEDIDDWVELEGESEFEFQEA